MPRILLKIHALLLVMMVTAPMAGAAEVRGVFKYQDTTTVVPIRRAYVENLVPRHRLVRLVECGGHDHDRQQRPHLVGGYRQQRDVLAADLRDERRGDRLADRPSFHAVLRPVAFASFKTTPRPAPVSTLSFTITNKTTANFPEAATK